MPSMPRLREARETCLHGLPDVTISTVCSGRAWRKGSMRSPCRGSPPVGRRRDHTSCSRKRCGGRAPRRGEGRPQEASAFLARSSSISTKAEATKRAGSAPRRCRTESSPTLPRVLPAKRSRYARGRWSAPCCWVVAADSPRRGRQGKDMSIVGSSSGGGIHLMSPLGSWGLYGERRICTAPAATHVARAASTSAGKTLRRGEDLASLAGSGTAVVVPSSAQWTCQCWARRLVSDMGGDWEGCRGCASGILTCD